MEVGPGSYWDAQPPENRPGRYVVLRLVPSDDGPFVYARNVVTQDAVVVRLDRWIQGFREMTP